MSLGVEGVEGSWGGMEEEKRRKGERRRERGKEEKGERERGKGREEKESRGNGEEKTSNFLSSYTLLSARHTESCGTSTAWLPQRGQSNHILWKDVVDKEKETHYYDPTLIQTRFLWLYTVMSPGRIKLFKYTIFLAQNYVTGRVKLLLVCNCILVVTRLLCFYSVTQHYRN